MAADSSETTDVRSDCENPVEKNLANRHPVDASQQETPFLQGPLIMEVICEKKPEGNKWKLSGLLRGSRQRFGNGNTWKCSTGVLLVFLVISVTVNIFLLAKLYQVPAAPRPPDATSPSLDASPCPQGWVRNRGRCYFFSDTEVTWNASQIKCSSQGGSLVTMDTPQEKEFVLGFQHLIYFWLGFWREDVGRPWKRADGSPFNNRFRIAGEGLCSYMNEGNSTSTYCDSKRYWICTKDIPGH
ncbi:UNVERIFIED_CONTAM: hypothetical protein K2H54_003575 [Gekko kuhli]